MALQNGHLLAALKKLDAFPKQVRRRVCAHETIGEPCRRVVGHPDRGDGDGEQAALHLPATPAVWPRGSTRSAESGWEAAPRVEGRRRPLRGLGPSPSRRYPPPTSLAACPSCTCRPPPPPPGCRWDAVQREEAAEFFNRTAAGGAITIVSALFMALLFFSELRGWRRGWEQSWRRSLGSRCGTAGHGGQPRAGEG